MPFLRPSRHLQWALHLETPKMVLKYAGFVNLRQYWSFA
jgi:hypothetical protein